MSVVTMFSIDCVLAWNPKISFQKFPQFKWNHPIPIISIFACLMNRIKRKTSPFIKDRHHYLFWFRLCFPVAIVSESDIIAKSNSLSAIGSRRVQIVFHIPQSESVLVAIWNPLESQLRQQWFSHCTLSVRLSNDFRSLY